MDWDTFGRLITGVLSVTTIIATALVGTMFGSLKTLRDTANDLRIRVADLERERLEDRAENVKLLAENQWLESRMTGRVEWKALVDQLNDHHTQALVWWKKAEGDLAAIARELE